MEAVFSKELPRFEIRDGLVHYIMPNGREEVRKLADFRVVTQMAVDALAAHAAEHGYGAITPGIEYIDSIPDFEIRDGRVYYTNTVDGRTLRRCFPLRAFRAAITKAQSLLDEWDSRDTDPIPFPRKAK